MKARWWRSSGFFIYLRIMEEVAEILQRIKNLKVLIPLFVKEEIVNSRELIAEMNRDQLLHGEKADGTDMPDYVGTKKTGKVNLFDTGEFHEDIDVLFDDVSLSLYGADEKTSYLVGRYGDILGLTPENIAILAARIVPKVMIRLNKL